MPSPAIREDGDQLMFEWPDGRPSWQLSHNGAFQSQFDWYYQYFLAVEAERGYDFKQDLFTPGPITATLQPDDPVGLVLAASTQARSWRDYRAAFERAAAVRPAEEPRTQPARIGGSPARVGGAGSAVPARRDSPSRDDELVGTLRRAADDFLVIRGRDLMTVIAGYPWFTDWGRDTFISLPGLCLVPGRFEDARRIILAFAAHVDNGMIPNRFPDFGEAPEYNTVDATLWYIHAVDRYLTYSGDWDFIAERMFSIIAEIVEAHERGTRHGIRLAEDGLLAAGEPGFALTWMDARTTDRSFTPRIGKPVEIDALWYNALCIACNYADRLGRIEQAGHWRGLAARCRASFNERFWNAAAGCLYDVVDVDDRAGVGDGAIRPNQLLAISLTHPVLSQERWVAVVEACRRDLLTPIGLRTLSPSDPAYRGRYEGDLLTRDSAYHQGTVWPWLFGPFLTAYVKVHGGNESARSTARRLLDGLTAHLSEAGIGSVSEVADGDAPHRPGGCPWQAWSVAEPLRALCEDILQTHPQSIHPDEPASHPDKRSMMPQV
jgi:glycogen debranching enzyme